MHLFAQIAPQRSTQYAALAATLAPHELKLSPLGPLLSRVEPVTLGRQAYLRLTLTEPPGGRVLAELGSLATVSAFFQVFDRIGDVEGPLLRPLDAPFTPRLPVELMMARRYRGKTNELFTHFLCNVARFSSGFANQPWDALRVFDPLMGGGTTLLVGLVLGADAAGVERNQQDAASTANFLRQFAREEGIACKVREERREAGRRWWFTLGKVQPQTCLLAAGDAVRAHEHLEGFRRPHLLVTDLPYGIQHQGRLEALLTQALPVWTELLLDAGALVFSWESTRFPRQRMIALVENAAGLRVRDEPPYNQLAHPVDRVIKRRDVIVANKR